ncbi:MAG: hypothetical protein IPM37_07595 [Hahellaceae bacterium]|nr:hypothetical protein [Hahellaceae bacterium]
METPSTLKTKWLIFGRWRILHQHQAGLAVDNCFCTPVLQKAFAIRCRHHYSLGHQISGWAGALHLVGRSGPIKAHGGSLWFSALWRLYTESL